MRAFPVVLLMVCWGLAPDARGAHWINLWGASAESSVLSRVSQEAAATQQGDQPYLAPADGEPAAPAAELWSDYCGGCHGAAYAPACGCPSACSPAAACCSTPVLDAVFHGHWLGRMCGCCDPCHACHGHFGRAVAGWLNDAFAFLHSCHFAADVCGCQPAACDMQYGDMPIYESPAPAEPTPAAPEATDMPPKPPVESDDAADKSASLPGKWFSWMRLP